MRIYAVMDLKGGQVVHAVAGRRNDYQPVCSPLVQSSDPRQVACAMIDRWGIYDAYVADLDALCGDEPDLKSIDAIAAVGMRFVLDAGIADPLRAAALPDRLIDSEQLAGLVVPLESTLETDYWPQLVAQLGPLRAVFSLDLQSGQPLTRAAQLADQSPLDIAHLAWQAGFRRLIALDLHRVGTGEGPSTAKLCHALRQQHDWTELVSGGGVRNAADLQMLSDVGCHSVLVATALHRCGDGARKMIFE